MWPKADFDYPADKKLLQHLNANEVQATRLPVAEHRRLETEWRRIYQTAFTPGHKFLHDTKADYAYRNEPCTHWLIVPFLSKVPGTSVNPQHHLSTNAFECRGPLLSLEDFINVEFFVAPPDLSWTFVRTHEDYVFGGPYFARYDGPEGR